VSAVLKEMDKLKTKMADKKLVDTQIKAEIKGLLHLKSGKIIWHFHNCI
jgi:hypothetical protein